MRERTGEYGNAIGRLHPCLHENDVTPVDSAQAASRSSACSDAERIALETVVADLEPETVGDVLEHCRQSIRIYA